MIYRDWQEEVNNIQKQLGISDWRKDQERLVAALTTPLLEFVVNEKPGSEEGKWMYRWHELCCIELAERMILGRQHD